MPRMSGLITISHPKLRNPEIFYRQPFVTSLVEKEFCSLCKSEIPSLTLKWQGWEKNIMLCKSCWEEGTKHD